jgi:single-strand DNA-binding protein
MNLAILIGNVGADPEIRYTQSGDPVATVSLATSARWTDKQSGEKKERTEWHRLSVFGKTAKVVADYVNKGSRIAVQGEIRYEDWTDKDGNKRYSTKIHVRNLELLGGKKSEESGPEEPPTQNGGFQATDDDVPF